MSFLYPHDEPPRGDAIPELHVPVRVGESTLVDLAVVDAASRSLVLRAGGTDTRHATATLIQEDRESREAAVAGFTAATAQMIEHFDSALTQFEADVRTGLA